MENTQVVTEKIQEPILKGRIMGPILRPLNFERVVYKLFTTMNVYLPEWVN